LEQLPGCGAAAGQHAITGAQRRLAVVFAGACLLANSVWGAANYSTPYAISTIAGQAGVPANTDGTNGAALFYNPAGMALDASGNLYVVDQFENTVRKLAPVGTNWVVTTIAGQPSPAPAGSADGTNTVATFNGPTGIAIDAAGCLYVADSGNNTIRRMVPLGTNWVTTTIAGAAGGSGGYADGTNGAASFDLPYGLTVDAATNVFVADSLYNLIRKVSPQGTNWVVTTIAGNALDFSQDSVDGTNQDARFFEPYAVTVDSHDNLFVTDGGAATIRKITPQGTNWVTTTIAGKAFVSGIDDGTNSSALFEGPFGIVVDANENLFIADSYANTIRELVPQGTNWISSTLAGLGNVPGTNDGTGNGARLNFPWGIVVTPTGTIYVADSSNDDIRKGVLGAVPNLSILMTGPGAVQVYWPGASGTLLTNADLSTTNWVAYGGAVTTSNGTNSVSFTAPPATLFFRLTQ
jgi:sugar lactone lactonase YvrE